MAVGMESQRSTGDRPPCRRYRHHRRCGGFHRPRGRCWRECRRPIAGSLIGVGVPEAKAHIYAEGVRRGGVLLTVSIDSARAERVDVDAVLRRYGVVDIDQRSAGWHATGWNAAMMTGDTGQGVKDSREGITEPGAVVKTGDATACFYTYLGCTPSSSGRLMSLPEAVAVNTVSTGIWSSCRSGFWSKLLTRT